MSFTSVKYSFHIKLPDNSNLYLTELDKPIIIDQNIFFPNSGMILKEGSFNDSGHNYIMIEGIYEKNGVEKHHDLVHSTVKIYKCFPSKIEHFVTYNCSNYIKRDLDFTLYLISYTENYNQSILQSYSKNCRANFGDARCRVNKSMYSSYYDIQEIFAKTIVISNLDKETGYYICGDVYLGDKKFHSKIVSHVQNLLTLDKIIPENMKHHKNVMVTAGCDKKFITCCNKFNNAVNFRGEPLIPNDDFIKL